MCILSAIPNQTERVLLLGGDSIGFEQPIRHCFHPGASTMPDLPQLTDGPEISQMDMLRGMMSYIWPKDNYYIRQRVCISLGLLVGAKSLNVCVPFIFKSAVDNLSSLNLETFPEASLAITSSLIIGCESDLASNSNDEMKRLVNRPTFSNLY